MGYHCKKYLGPLKIPRPVEVYKYLLYWEDVCLMDNHNISPFYISFHDIVFSLAPRNDIGISRQIKMSKLKNETKLKHLCLSSSGDLYWIENQYVMMNRDMYQENVTKKYSTHIVLKKKNICMLSKKEGA